MIRKKRSHIGRQTRLKNKGITITRLKMAFKTEDTGPIKTGLTSSFQADSGTRLNNTWHNSGMMGFIDYLEQKGVDTGQLKTAFRDGDITAVKEWFEKSQEAHRVRIMNDIIGRELP